MRINYLEEQLFSKNLFLHEEYLEINYIPVTLLHREQELIMLSKIFVKMLEDPFLISRKVSIQGEIGIGKTVIAKTFGKMLLLSAVKRNLNIHYIHVNCRKEKTPYSILNRILSELKCKIPNRGYSPQELTFFLEDFLIKSQTYLVLTLDELNYLEKSHYNLIYSLSRCNESSLNKRNYLSLIVIVRNLALLGTLDDSTKSTLQGNILSLKKYNKEQIFNILSERIKISLKENVISPELVNYISVNIESSGDIRKGLNIIRNATKIAETKEKNHVGREEIDIALQNMIPNLHTDIFDILNYHQIILFYSILKIIINKGEQNISYIEIKETYNQLCDEFEEESRKHTQIWSYIQQFENYGLISVNTISKNIRGRKSYISISDLPILSLYKELEKKIRDFNSEM